MAGESGESPDDASGPASSPFHFHRQFRKMTGETFASCLRRIRLEKGMVMLRDSGKTVTDIAYECGYASSEMFSRAVKSFWGLTPTQLRRMPSWHPRIGSPGNFHYLKNSESRTWFYLGGKVDNMTTKIIEFPEKRVWCYGCRGDFWELPRLWGKIFRDREEGRLPAGAGEFLSLFPDHDPAIPQERKRAYAGFVSPEPPRGDHPFEEIPIPGGLYAVTVHYGSSEEIGPVWEKWRESWAPHSGWSLDYGRPCYEWYQNRPENPELTLTFLVTPVEKSGKED